MAPLQRLIARSPSNKHSSSLNLLPDHLNLLFFFSAVFIVLILLDALIFKTNVGCYVPNNILIVMQETLKSIMEGSVIPGFEMSCKAMFEQVDLTFQKGFAEHTGSALQQFESMHSPLVHALRVWLLSSGFITTLLFSC